MTKSIFLMLGAAFCALISACSDDSAETKPDPGVEGLQKTMLELQTAIQAGETDKAAKITRGFLISEKSELDALLGDDCPSDAKDKIFAMQEKFNAASDAEIATALKVDKARSEITAYAATGAEIKARAEGSIVSKEYPGGTTRMAELGVLHPDKTYYEIELTEPGDEYGMKYHLFVWNGNGWKMLGPIWRTIK